MAEPRVLLACDEVLDDLVNNKVPFVLYRLPDTKEPRLIIQHGADVQRISDFKDLSSVSGFLMAPFAMSERNPMAVIRADESISGDMPIIEYLLERYHKLKEEHSCSCKCSDAACDCECDEAAASTCDCASGSACECTKDKAAACDGEGEDGPVEINGATVKSGAFVGGELCFKERVEDNDVVFARYQKVFDRFSSALKERRFDKLVLSRCEKYAYAPFGIFSSFARACALYPNMTVSVVNSEATGTWFGATPEILLKGDGRKFATMSLAGTMNLACYRNELREKLGFSGAGSDFCCCGASAAAAGAAAALGGAGAAACSKSAVSSSLVTKALSEQDIASAIPQLADWSAKDVEEQGYVTSYIEEVLSRYSNSIEKSGPKTAAAGPVCHLKTDFSFSINNPKCLGEIIGALHPTPAVCGLPKLDAYKFIQENEGYDRAYYAGMLGPLNMEGQSALYVNLRCMQLIKEQPNVAAANSDGAACGTEQCCAVHSAADAVAGAYAGAAVAPRSNKTIAACYIGGGILRQSDLNSEFNEGSNKVATILSAVNDDRYQEALKRTQK